ncbi:MAG: phosphatase [Opitutus sp.]|nr:phosphatase [Opitutus sp.]
MPPPVAVIDIGSNSIKIMVAVRHAAGAVAALHTRTLEARISAGISGANPALSEEGMSRGLEAIRTLLADATTFGAGRTILVATSAVRDARNGPGFRERVRTETGHTIRILTGLEEASLIGQGLTCDPALDGLQDFYVFDLGGGSLECLAFRRRQMDQAASLQLGCVRLTERFVVRLDAPLPPDAREAIAAHTRELIARSGFEFSLPGNTVAVGTGGTVATVRAVLAARSGHGYEHSDPVVTAAQLEELLAWLGPMTLAERWRVGGLPSARADIFPTALTTLLALAEYKGIRAFRHSLYNLRYGLAAEALADPLPPA